MSILEGVLREELERLERNIGICKEKLNMLPKGTIYIQKIGNSSFVYRKWRENKKVICEYIGKLNDAESLKAIEQANDYRRLKRMISNASKELIKLRKAIRAYE